MSNTVTSHEFVDRTLHHVDPLSTTTFDAPSSLALPVQTVVTHQAESVETVPYDPWAPPQFRSTIPPAVAIAPSITGDPIAAAQLNVVARSSTRLDRARAYADRLGTHAITIRAKIAAASESQVAAAIGKAASEYVDAGPLRGEAVEVDRQHRQALAILDDVEAEHARHQADLDALFGSDGVARTKLKEAQEARALTQTAANDANAILDRANTHAETVNVRLHDALESERRHDDAVTARLHAALVDGDTPASTVEPFTRLSAGLQDDLRTARAAVDRLAAEHGTRLNALATADRAVLAAVDGVLLIEADRMAQELAALDARTTLLRSHLAAYAQRTAGDFVGPPQIESPAKMHSGGWLVREIPPTVVPPKVKQTPAIAAAVPAAQIGQALPAHPAATSAWGSYAEALVSNPTAQPWFPDDLPIAVAGQHASASAIPTLATIHRQIRDASQVADFRRAERA